MDPSRNSQRSYGVPPAATSFPFWSPNVFYPQASLVWYAGSVWRCEAPHTSGALAREPNLSPHLWTPISDANDRPQTQATAYGRISPLPSYDGKTGTYITNYREVYDRGGRGSSTGVGSSACLPSLAPSPVTQVRPYSDRSRLNALLEEAKAARSSGALRNELLGARTWRVGGVGVFAYAEDPAIERTRKQAWREFTEANGRSAWLSAARARTAAYSQAKTRGELHPLLRWELVEDSAPLPPEAIPCGFESGGNELYAARMWHENGMHVGKVGAHLDRRVEWALDGKTCRRPEDLSVAFEVLCGDASAAQWARFSDGLPANIPGWQPVEGGRTRDGVALLIARSGINGGVHLGEVQVDSTAASIPFEDEGRLVRSFEVLIYESYQRR